MILIHQLLTFWEQLHSSILCFILFCFALNFLPPVGTDYGVIRDHHGSLLLSAPLWWIPGHMLALTSEGHVLPSECVQSFSVDSSVSDGSWQKGADPCWPRLTKEGLYGNDVGGHGHPMQNNFPNQGIPKRQAVLENRTTSSSASSPVKPPRCTRGDLEPSTRSSSETWSQCPLPPMICGRHGFLM